MALQVITFIIACLSLVVSILSTILLIRKRYRIKYEFYVLLNLIVSDIISPLMYILLCFWSIVDKLDCLGVRVVTSFFISFHLLSAINESVVGLKRYLKIKRPLTFCKTYFKKRMIFISLLPWFVTTALIISLTLSENKNGTIATNELDSFTTPKETLLFVKKLASPLLILVISLHTLFFAALSYSHLTIWNTARYHKRSYKLTVKGFNPTKGSVKVLHLYKARRKVILILGTHLLAFLPYISMECFMISQSDTHLINKSYMTTFYVVSQVFILCRGLFNSFNYVVMDVAKKECSFQKLYMIFSMRQNSERKNSQRYFLTPENPDQPRRSSQQSILTEASYV